MKTECDREMSLLEIKGLSSEIYFYKEANLQTSLLHNNAEIQLCPTKDAVRFNYSSTFPYSI